MSTYVDGFVIPLPKSKLAAYRRIAKKASVIWRDHGAIAYFECAGDDLDFKFGTPFTKLAKTKPDETVIFAWAVFKNRRARDKANAAIMKDPRMEQLPEESKNLFDCKRMAYGGFKVIVTL